MCTLTYVVCSGGFDHIFHLHNVLSATSCTYVCYMRVFLLTCLQQLAVVMGYECSVVPYPASCVQCPSLGDLFDLPLFV